MEQQETKALKTRSFRISEETIAKFKEMTEEIGGNQDEVLAKLIETYEFQKGKVILTDKKEDIEKFEQYMGIVTRMYMSSLEDNQNTEELVRGQFQGLLNSKDSIIQDLQARLAEQRIMAENAVAEQSRTEVALSELQKEFDTLTNLVTEKEHLLEEIKENRDTYKEQVLSLFAQVEESKSTVNKMKNLEEEIKELKEQLRVEENKLEKVKLEQDKKLLKIQGDYQEQLNSIKESKNNEIEEYQIKYKELLNQLENKQVKTES